MKIHKVVGAYNLEQATSEGWELAETFSSSRIDKTSCSTPIATDGYNGGSSGYGSPGSVSSYVREEALVVHEPLFRVTKDSGVASYEEQLKAEMWKLRDSLAPHELKHQNDEREIKALTKQVEELTGKCDQLQRSLNESRTLFSSERIAKQALEAYLAKIRTAIGTVRFDEIIKA
jgi:hypothetical protein